jgi:23S rRNA pseudouridine2605 synthase
VAKERIAKFLARAGVASRRDAERLITAGRVRLDGAVVTHPATLVGPEDRVVVDNSAVAAAQPSRLWCYHKPAGLVTTTRDPEGRLTVFASLPADLPRVVSVGRLDLDTEGLLLLTNDGELARYLEHPDHRMPRTYRVRAHGISNDAALTRLAKGITVRGIRYRPVAARFDRRQGGNSWFTLTLREGKNREIKKLFEAIGLQVTRLIRIGYGPFELAELKRGAVAEVPAARLPRLLPGFFQVPPG